MRPDDERVEDVPGTRAENAASPGDEELAAGAGDNSTQSIDGVTAGLTEPRVGSTTHPMCHV